ncbi:MAG: hypothetical protein V3R93_06745, partial [Candidatus Hydrothermarchaeaceae archaeon]
SLSKIFDEGEHDIKVEVTDNTGAKASETIKVTVAAQPSPTPQPTTAAALPAEEKQTSPLVMILLGVVIGVVIVGAVLYVLKKKGTEDDWEK